MAIDKLDEVPYPGIVPWLAIRKKVNEIIENAGDPITVDSELSGESENPVQNKVITGALADKADASALEGKANITTGDSAPDYTTEGEIGDIYIHLTTNGAEEMAAVYILYGIDSTDPNDISYTWAPLIKSVSLSNTPVSITMKTQLAVAMRMKIDYIDGEVEVVGGGSAIAIRGIPLCPYTSGNTLHLPILFNDGTTIKELTLDTATPGATPYYDSDEIDTCSLTIGRISLRVTN